MSNVVAIAAGGWHSLALKAEGTVIAWGRNDYGQCTVPGALTGVVAIAAGYNHSLALKRDGTVVAWGLQHIVPSDLNGVIAIAAAADHSMALKQDGTVVAWARGMEGQNNVPSGLSNVVAIADGGYQELALRADGTVVSWGTPFPGPRVPSGVVAIAEGLAHGLALTGNGRIAAWGSADGTVPSGLRGVVAIAAGGVNGLALFDSAATNRPPIPGAFPLAAWRDLTYTLGAAEVIRVCTDPDDDLFALTRAGPASTAGGSVALSGDTIAYTPPRAFSGIDTFAYTVVDARGASAQGIVTITVKGWPACQFATWRDQAHTFDLADLTGAGGDTNSGAFSVVIDSIDSTAGGVVMPAGSRVTYTPPRGFTGTDSFAYVVTDARGNSAPGTATITVKNPATYGPDFAEIIVASASVRLRLEGFPGQVYRIEASNDLLNWVTLGEATTGPDGFLELADSDRNLSPCRYYRATF